MTDFDVRVCIFCQPKRHYETGPDGEVVEVTVPPRCGLCVAWGDARRWCEHDCWWLTDEQAPRPSEAP